jgi:hypothetical protein
MVRKTTSLKIDEELWKKLKIYCIINNKEISGCLEELIKKEIKEKGEKK